jgi:AcrR family transcriptional regulator
VTERFGQVFSVAVTDRCGDDTQMTMESPCPAETAAVEQAAGDAPESAKRRQIIEGARRVFLREGFDAASMGEIAREAGVSKGTLYVYFESKEALFAALVGESKRATAERNLAHLDPEDPDLRRVLTRFASGLIEKVTEPEHMALVRMVVAAAEKFPAVGRTFYEAGPAYGHRCLAVYLEDQRRRGRLDIPDAELSAGLFQGMCLQSLAAAILTGAETTPSPEKIARIAGNAVDMLLRAYAPRG